MKCDEIDKLMMDYLDNNLDESLTREIEKHLETCERCLDELKDSQHVLSLISEGEMTKPDDSLRINFYHMLHTEIKKEEAKNSPAKTMIPWYNMSSYRVAAAVALLIAGTFLGVLINNGINNSTASDEIAQLRLEVSDLKKATMFTMLKGGSSSERIEAVSYASDLDNADDNVINVLIKTLNNDKNVNVRMAAAYAISKFADQKTVCDSLVKSLSQQNDPILQITLINILAEKKEKSALKTIQDIIANEKTLREVKAVAENSLRVLI
jgi:HEAT repeat protein